MSKVIDISSSAWSGIKKKVNGGIIHSDYCGYATGEAVIKDSENTGTQLFAVSDLKEVNIHGN